MNNTTNSAQNLVILDNPIRNVDGMYSLNDLHKASGGESKDRPTFFLKSPKTVELVDEIEQCATANSAINVVNGGNDRGTYACKQIVIAYAAWISPKFNLAVIDAFLEKHEKPQVNPLELTRMQILEYAIEAEQKLEEAKPKLIAFNRIAESEGSETITRAAKTLQVKPNYLFKWLDANSWIYRRVGNKEWTGYQTKIDQGLLEHKVSTYFKDGEECVSTQVRITPKGITKLSEKLGEAA